MVSERFAPDGQGGEVRAPGVAVTFSVRPPPPPAVVIPALPPGPAHPKALATAAAREREAARDLGEMAKWCKRLVRLIAQRAEGFGDPNAAWRPFQRVVATNGDGLASIFVEPDSVVDVECAGEFPYANLVAPEGAGVAEADLEPPGVRGQVDLRTWVPPDPAAPGDADDDAPHADGRPASQLTSMTDDPTARLPFVALSVQRLSPAVVQCRDHLGEPCAEVELEIEAESIPSLGARGCGVLWRGATGRSGDSPKVWLPTGSRVTARVVRSPFRYVPPEVGAADGFAQEAAWVVTDVEAAVNHRITVPGKPFLDIRAFDLATGEGIMGLRVQARAFVALFSSRCLLCPLCRLLRLSVSRRCRSMQC